MIWLQMKSGGEGELSSLPAGAARTNQFVWMNGMFSSYRGSRWEFSGPGQCSRSVVFCGVFCVAFDPVLEP